MDLFHFYQYFPIDDHTGQPVTDAEMVALQYSRLTQLQRLFFKYHPSLRELALSNCGTLQKRSVLEPAVKGLDFAELQTLVMKQLRFDVPAKPLPYESCAALQMILADDVPECVPAAAYSRLPGLIRGPCHRLVADDDPWAQNPEFLVEVVVSKYERRRSQTETVNAMPLYPTEAILGDENQVPKVHYTGEPYSV